jgi:hypothetical protein
MTVRGGSWDAGMDRPSSRHASDFKSRRVLSQVLLNSP